MSAYERKKTEQYFSILAAPPTSPSMNNWEQVRACRASAPLPSLQWVSIKCSMNPQIVGSFSLFLPSSSCLVQLLRDAACERSNRTGRKKQRTPKSEQVKEKMAATKRYMCIQELSDCDKMTFSHQAERCVDCWTGQRRDCLIG